MAVDMLNTIMDTVIELLPGYYNEGLLSSDSRYLKSLVRGPLQDDPTTRSYFLTISIDVEAGGRKPVAALTNVERTALGPMPEYEIGGGYLMVNYFKLDGWTPRKTTAVDNYALAGAALEATERALARMKYNEFMNTIATDSGMEFTTGLLNIFSSLDRGFRVLGGENERYGVIWHRFAVFSQVEPEHWS